MEWWATFRRAPLLIATLVAATVPLLAAAQPGAAGVTLVASGLAFPRGFTWDESGSMYVALAGDGSPPTAAMASSGTTGTEHAFGLFYAGFNGAVVKITRGVASRWQLVSPQSSNTMGGTRASRHSLSSTESSTPRRMGAEPLEAIRSIPPVST